ncbi:hypothetical protein Nepgr_034003 [Nepenthes gracilis]|uniref:Uncharacterized protein n=1 Tax=Nepenthes gracilis TaxID=150966 RepID=A0AAD3Y923_NEPGR|nr:hypothetical protein Nepgr_034003 [Nepenthes gracilis]
MSLLSIASVAPKTASVASQDCERCSCNHERLPPNHEGRLKTASCRSQDAPKSRLAPVSPPGDRVVSPQRRLRCRLTLTSFSPKIARLPQQARRVSPQRLGESRFQDGRVSLAQDCESLLKTGRGVGKPQRRPRSRPRSRVSLPTPRVSLPKMSSVAPKDRECHSLHAECRSQDWASVAPKDALCRLRARPKVAPRPRVSPPITASVTTRRLMSLPKTRVSLPKTAAAGQSTSVAPKTGRVSRQDRECRPQDV